MVYRIFVEKKPQFRVGNVRVINRYDVEGIDESLFNKAVNTVFSEPQVDDVYFDFGFDLSGKRVLAVEALPGQFDMRANSASECIALISCGEKPVVKSATIYILPKEVDFENFKSDVLNPVESREANLVKPETLTERFDTPSLPETIAGFTTYTTEQLADFVAELGLAMDTADAAFCRDYFASEHRDPTITEIKIIDTYWSDHCRHTTFLTTIKNAVFENSCAQKSWDEYLRIREELGRSEKPINFMDIATIGAKYLRANGGLKNLDESEEINACTIKIDVDVNGKSEPWLLLFKNETHNHPTEIEPFGGAATCIGGAIRDPLSGRAYVYQAMRITGASDPFAPTLSGKLPQKKIITTAANGYSSYGNQIGLATGIVDEIYHDGYVAKHMELGAVLGAAPAANVRREVPSPGDVVLLLGGKTGRDGCGGATGSSKSHTAESVETCGAEVQKGNAPEERKIQRLFRNPSATKLIKRCNDFGAGGVSVAVGELADGLLIDLSAVPKKYAGLSATELAISESQERMAVVIEKENAEEFAKLASAENLECTKIAVITEQPRMTMTLDGNVVADLSREFLNSNGAAKYADAKVVSSVWEYNPAVDVHPSGIKENFKQLVSSLNVCSKQGLSERFDSTIGANTVLMPFGGKTQKTPIQAMAAKIPVLYGETKTTSVFSYGYNPFITEKNPYDGAYLAVLESIAKNVATGGKIDTAYFTFQEFFERLREDETRWGKPLAALLGSLQAQIDFGIASIGGKDSMSGSFEDIDVPPTLISFCVTVTNSDDVISPEFKKAGSKVVYIEYKNPGQFKETAKKIEKLITERRILSAFTPTIGGIAEGVFKATLGNKIGFKFADGIDATTIFGYSYGGFVLEVADDVEIGTVLGETTAEFAIDVFGEKVDCAELQSIYEDKLESIYKTTVPFDGSVGVPAETKGNMATAPAIKTLKPKVVIPVFPGTNCEYDTARAFEKAGASADIFVVNTLTPSSIAESAAELAKRIEESQLVFIPGGFSGGDEPDGSGKFITAFFRNPAIAGAVTNLLDCRDGLVGGICNGFQALIKLGLVPYGKIIMPDESSPTLTFNTIHRHQSKLVRVRVASNNSPWLSGSNVGDSYLIPISHGEGRVVCSDELLSQLIANGQVATQYADASGVPTMDIAHNPNGSTYAIEGLLSQDGRVFGRMGHAERYGDNLYKNVGESGGYEMFAGAVEWFV